MKQQILIILTLLTCSSLYGQAKDNCIKQECFGDSITRTYFCGKFNYERSELEDLRFFCGFTHKDSFFLADLDFVDVKIIEGALHEQLNVIMKGKSGQSNSLDIQTKIHRYHRQYFCYVAQNGDLILLANFLFFHHKSDVPDLSRPAFYTDGGSRFWKIKYNTRTKVFFDLKINGRA